MIPYEDLCRALDIHNRKLRGEEVPELDYQQPVMDDDFDIVESADAGAHDISMDMEEYGDGVPDVTAETAVPQADFGAYDQPGSGEYGDAGYDQAPEQPAGTYPDDQDPNRPQ
jgi:hypothetical protein